MKNVAILGSTGSIGINALKVIESLPGRFRVAALSSFSNTDILTRQIKRFKPAMVTVVDTAAAKRLKNRVRGPRIYSTIEGLDLIASHKDIDIVIVAISGASAIYPLLASIAAEKHICLANKESIVMAGNIIMTKAKGSRAKIIPVDSEHNAIFQCMHSSANHEVSRLFLTGSGGSLRNIAKSRFSSLKMKQVLNHPKWNMGKKITVDSATLMNKGLEIIEAQHLFDMPVNKIKLLIHPQAIIHSMVEFADGAVIAQLGPTDMKLPIQYALTYPERIKGNSEALDFSEIKSLNFYNPDTEKYPCLSLAIAAAKLGDTYPAALNAANEIAVKAFLNKEINFTSIPKIIENVLLRHRRTEKPCLDDILKTDAWAREEAISLC